jgi:hypothetical protein
MGFKYMRMRLWTCPRDQYKTQLEIQHRRYPEEVSGSTLWKFPPTSLWNHVKNCIYTEILRIRIWLHTRCEYC